MSGTSPRPELWSPPRYSPEELRQYLHSLRKFLTGGVLDRPPPEKLTGIAVSALSTQPRVTPGEFFHWLTDVRDMPGRNYRLERSNLLCYGPDWESCRFWVYSKGPEDKGPALAGILLSHMKAYSESNGSDWGGQSPLLPLVQLEYLLLRMPEERWLTKPDYCVDFALPTILAYPEMVPLLKETHKYLDSLTSASTFPVELLQLHRCEICGERTIGMQWVGCVRRPVCHLHVREHKEIRSD